MYDPKVSGSRRRRRFTLIEALQRSGRQVSGCLGHVSAYNAAWLLGAGVAFLATAR